MFINFNLLKESGLSAGELVLLQGIKQKEYLLFSKSINTLKKLKEQGYLKTVGKETNIEYRLDKKGKNFLKDLEIADVTNESKYLAMSLISLYEDNGIAITNKKKIVEMVSWFLSEVEFDSEYITSVVADYLQSFSANEKKFISQLHNLIWKGESVYSINWNLSQSKLYGMLKQ